MVELVMDADGWETTDDLYQSFFQVVGAPSWHGKNYSALRDSIGTGAINQIEVPYQLIVKNYDRVHPFMKEQVDGFVAMINELAFEGVPVAIRVETSTGPNYAHAPHQNPVS